MPALVLPNVLFASAPLLASPVPPDRFQINQNRYTPVEAIIESQVSLPFGSMLLFASSGLTRKNHTKAEATSSLRVRKLLNRRCTSV